MKILFCTFSLTKGGAERVISNLANYFVVENKVLIVLIHNCSIEYSLNGKINVKTLDKNSYSSNNIKKIISKVSRNLKRTKSMTKTIEDFDPDVIISFLPVPSYITLLSNRKTNKKVIVSVRNDPNIEYKNFFMKKLMKFLYPKADGFVFQTKEAQDYFKNIIYCKQEVIPNPINPLFMSEPYKGERKKEIVSVGRLTGQKNFDCLIEAFSKISDEFNDYKLIIYGTGELREELEDKIIQLNLKERVLLPGVVDNIKSKIYSSTVFVLPSLYEGMPNALMEAMAMGLPVISTDCPCGGPRELINDGINGLLIKVNNVDDLSNAMRKIIKDKNFGDRLGSEASNIKNKLNPNMINKRWEEFIKDVVNQEK